MGPAFKTRSSRGEMERRTSQTSPSPPTKVLFAALELVDFFPPFLLPQEFDGLYSNFKSSPFAVLSSSHLKYHFSGVDLFTVTLTIFSRVYDLFFLRKKAQRNSTEENRGTEWLENLRTFFLSRSCQKIANGRGR